MNFSYVVATFFVLSICAWIAYKKTRDTLHPLLVISPLFVYSYAFEPYKLMKEGHLDLFFKDPSVLDYVLLVNFLSVSAFMIGGLIAYNDRRAVTHFFISEEGQFKLMKVAKIMCVVGLVCFYIGLHEAGGFIKAYSQHKGGGHYSSGYIGEAVNLGLAAGLFIALPNYRKGLNRNQVIWLILGVLPNLIQGAPMLGGRRGPLFLSLAVLAFAWFYTKRKPPTPIQLGAVILFILLSVVFVWTQRGNMHLGVDDVEFDNEKFEDVLMLKETDVGNNFIYGSGYILVSKGTKRYTWGKKIIVDLLVRPIPKQLWPTKYQDVGAYWITHTKAGQGVYSLMEWWSYAGFIPVSGSSAGSIISLYGEFGIGCAIAMGFIGWAFGKVRRKSVDVGGIWVVIYFEMLALSIYLATQSFSAFYQRLLILALPTYLLWRYYVQREEMRNRHGHRI